MNRPGSQRWFSFWAAAAALALLWPVPGVQATEADMDELPVVEPFLCQICHVLDSPSFVQADLNPFGLDFLDNGRVWNASLAVLDSDQDGCSNGVELGDADGDGNPDGNVTVLSSNPGRPGDCGELVIDAYTWGALKALFDDR